MAQSRQAEKNTKNANTKNFKSTQNTTTINAQGNTKNQTHKRENTSIEVHTENTRARQIPDPKNVVKLCLYY